MYLKRAEFVPLKIFSHFLSRYINSQQHPTASQQVVQVIAIVAIVAIAAVAITITITITITISITTKP